MRFSSGLPVTLLRALAACDRPVSARALVGRFNGNTVAVTLYRLHLEGHASRALLNGRYRYSITDAGREHLRRLDSGEREQIEGLERMVSEKLARLGILGAA